MLFRVERSDERWMVTDGAVRFGLYASQAKASEAALSLDELRGWAAPTPADLVDRRRA